MRSRGRGHAHEFDPVVGSAVEVGQVACIEVKGMDVHVGQSCGNHGDSRFLFDFVPAAAENRESRPASDSSPAAQVAPRKAQPRRRAGGPAGPGSRPERAEIA